jgi:hypothetical protein
MRKKLVIKMNSSFHHIHDHCHLRVRERSDFGMKMSWKSIDQNLAKLIAAVFEVLLVLVVREEVLDVHLI